MPRAAIFYIFTVPIGSKSLIKGLFVFSLFRFSISALLISCFLSACGGGSSSGSSTASDVIGHTQEQGEVAEESSGQNQTVNAEGLIKISDIKLSDETLDQCIKDIATEEGWETVDQITRIYCNENIETLDGMEIFSNYKNLVEFYIGGISLPLPMSEYSVDLTPLSGITSLEVLKVGGWYNEGSGYFSNIKDVSDLSGLVNLKELHLGNSNVSDISVISNFIDLEIFEVSHSNVDDISALADLLKLELVDISYTEVSEASYLSGLNNLKTLNIERTKISVNSLGILPDAIENLNVRGISGENIDGIGNIISLKRIFIDSNYDFEPLTNLDYLESLNINGCEKLSSILAIRSIETLQVSGCNDEDLDSLFTYENESLAWLVIYNPSILTNFESISKIKNLQGLAVSTEIKGCRPSLNNPEMRLSGLSEVNTLKSLSILCSNIVDVSDISNLNSLTYLNFSDSFIWDISPLSSLSNLEELVLASVDGEGVCTDDVEFLRAALPNTQIHHSLYSTNYCE